MCSRAERWPVETLQGCLDLCTVLHCKNVSTQTKSRLKTCGLECITQTAGTCLVSFEEGTKTGTRIWQHTSREVLCDGVPLFVCLNGLVFFFKFDDTRGHTTVQTET